MSKPHRPDSEALLAEASHWLMRLKSGNCSAADQTAFAAWIGQSSDHERAYAEAASLWQELQQLKDLAGPRLDAARALLPPAAQAHGQWKSAIGLGLAAALLIGLGAPLWQWLHTETYRTAKGERLHVDLSDGSSVDLNGLTELNIRPGQRQAQLIRGEAFFSVTHNERAPFEVSSTGGCIRDVGTRFNVRIQGERTVVAVVEGEVAIETTARNQTVNLLPGMQAAFDSTGRLSAPAPVDTEALVAWVNGKHLFRSRPLGEVLEQLGRAHDVELSLADPRWANQPVTGSFPNDNLKLALDTIAAALNLKVQQLDATHWALSAPTNPP